jgi:isocitrate/isopropylmalate dehydrogenase
MMCDWLNEKQGDKNPRIASDLIKESVEKVLREAKVRTYDLCIGKWESITPASTTQVTDAIIQSMKDIMEKRG